ncbi:monooxygenase [Pseudomonas aeruginosa]|uniref:Toluene o-xylene monooxygenase component TouD n=1 Tax=Stutzerimonas stutzeri TaxID=316 RepID=A0A0S2UNY1_STUST|nr:MmoB/DmpM family protein [Pseudomonas aeruginosa]ALP69207.1 toluene o-xylene monooxygenase component TouD [Stutzerimonas stutzeri]RUI12881.1 monooxygenase [Pseudomonas aeruginosa]
MTTNTVQTLSASDNALNNNMVGPVLRAGDVAIAVGEAAEIDNPGKEIKVDDKLAYVRIGAEDELILRKETIEECLGRPFRMQELEINLSSFAGIIDMDSDRVRFYFNKHL